MPENIIQIDQNLFETKLDRLVTEKMTQILNAMLDAEADEITGAARYERKEGRKAYRAGHYERKLTAKAGAGGRLFGAVTSKEISEGLKAQYGLDVAKSKIVQDEPIKAYGTYELKCKLGYEVSGAIQVVVAEA